MGGISYNSRGIESTVFCVLLILGSSLMVLPAGVKATNEPEAEISLWTGEDDSLSPCDPDLYELKVTNATREGLLGYGFIPYDSDVWREVGTWSTEPLVRDMEIMSDAACYVLLKDINGSEADIRIRIYIDGNQIGDTILLENEQIGASPELHMGTTGTSGTTISEGSQFQVRIDVMVVSESCYYIGGHMGSRVDFIAKPVTLSDIEYNDGEVTVTVKESFGVGFEDLTVEMWLDSSSITDFTQSRNGTNILLDFNRYLADGSYNLAITVKYSGGIVVGPYKHFTIDSTGQVTDDDDDDVYDDDDDDDDVHPYDDDDNDDPDIELLTFSECEHYYSDDTGDNIAYIAKFDENFNMETAIKIGNNRPIDITYVDIQRNGDDLEITVGVSGSLHFLSYVTAYFVDSDFSQPKPDLNRRFEVYPDYEPSNAVATNSLSADMPYWGASYEAEGSTVRIKGSLSDLMKMGLTSDFEVFVMADEIELEEDGDDVVSTYHVDYAGYRAYSITDADKDRVNKEKDDSLGLMEEYIPYLLASSLLVIAIIIVIVVIVVKGKNNPRR